MIVTEEAEHITGTAADHFKRWLRMSSYAGDPIQSSLRQPTPETKTVLLPGISFLIDHHLAEQVVDSLNKRFAYRSCLAFISDDKTREDKKHTVSLIYATDKYTILRLQETSGGSYHFSTDSLITKLKAFEQKYPFSFIGVGDEWVVLKPTEQPKDWIDFTKEVLKVCPNDEIDVNEYAKELQKYAGKVSMWWD